MGSRFSKVLRPHKAAASNAPARGTQSDNDNTRQDNSIQTTNSIQINVPTLFSRDDLDIATPNPLSAPTLRRQNSAPTSGMSQTQRRQAIQPSEEFLRAIQSEARERLPPNPISDRTVPPPPPPPPPPPASDTTALPPPPVEQPSPANRDCLMCGTSLPSESEPEYSTKVTWPCRECNNPVCAPCLKDMFLDACKDMSRMPPRCCDRVDLSYARHLLSEEEVALFRAKYEEWSTPRPFYCPVPTCSAFIPERQVPEQLRTRSKGKQRADSGVGTPGANIFACPTCTVDICTACRQVAHPGTNCEIKEFGLDPETAALFKAWGYRQCPRCGHGIKRMFGCPHMACHCGAQFCWHCRQQKNICDRDGCYPVDDDVSEIESDDSGETRGPDRPEEEDEDPADTDDQNEAADGNSPRRIRNLDGGGHRYWENQALDFGDEPQSQGAVQPWACDHDFTPYEVTLSDALQKSHASNVMECVRCWNPIYPSIEPPRKVHMYVTEDEKLTPIPARRLRHLNSQSRGIVRGRSRSHFTVPRGLFRHNATIGTAGHLTAALSVTHTSQSAPTYDPAPIHGFSFDRVITDIYGDVISTTPAPPKRRASFSAPGSVPDVEMEVSVESRQSKAHSNIFDKLQPGFSLAHECVECGIIVCEPCRDAAIKENESVAEDETPAQIEDAPVVEQALTEPEMEMTLDQEEAQESEVFEFAQLWH